MYNFTLYKGTFFVQSRLVFYYRFHRQIVCSVVSVDRSPVRFINIFVNFKILYSRLASHLISLI